MLSTTYIAAVITNTAHQLGQRLREERGQTAAEYMGILFVVAAIIAALITADVPEKIGDAAATLIDKIANGGG